MHFLYFYFIATGLVHLGATYEDTEADWKGTCNTGTNQSPINLDDNTVNHTFFEHTLLFKNYNQKVQGLVHEHSGRASINVVKPFDARIVLPNDTVDYILHDIHIHVHGSEHTVNSRRFTMEVHLVHYNSRYATMDLARNHIDGVVVIAVLVQEMGTVDNGAIDVLVKAHFNIFRNVTIFNVTVDDFLPINWKEYYYYKGSMTTPPCEEYISWIVIKDRIGVSKSQVKLLEDKIKIKYRSIKPVNNRTVYLITVNSAMKSTCNNTIMVMFYCIMLFVIKIT